MAAVIRTEGLTKRYGKTLALDSLDLTVREGEVYGYLVPAESFEVTAAIIMLGIAGTATVPSIRLFERRDLIGE